MSDGKAWLAIGLGLDVAATLFISLDAFRSQRQTTEIYKVLTFITGLDVVNLRTQPAREAANNASEQAHASLQSDTPEEEKKQMSEVDELDQIDAMLVDAERTADQHNKEILQGQLSKVADDFSSRKYLVTAAIAAVFVGGVCEFIGGVVLGA